MFSEMYFNSDIYLDYFSDLTSKEQTDLDVFDLVCNDLYLELGNDLDLGVLGEVIII
jgi:hypothetical protein